MGHPLPAPANRHAGRVRHLAVIALRSELVDLLLSRVPEGSVRTSTEDAVVLADLAGRPDGLARCTAARLPRTRMVVRASHRVARVVGLRSPVAAALHDALMWGVGRLGSTAVIRQTAPVFDWEPPETPAH